MRAVVPVGAAGKDGAGSRPPGASVARILLRNSWAEMRLGLALALLMAPAVVGLAAENNRARSDLLAAEGLGEVRYPSRALRRDEDGLPTPLAVPFVALNMLLTLFFSLSVYRVVVPLNLPTTRRQRLQVSALCVAAAVVQGANLCSPLADGVQVAMLLPALTAIVLLIERVLTRGAEDPAPVRAVGRRVIVFYMLMAALGNAVLVPYVLATDSSPGPRVALLLLVQPVALDAVHLLHRVMDERWGLRGLVEASAYAHAYFSVVRRVALFTLAGPTQAFTIFCIPLVEGLGRATLLQREQFYLGLLWRGDGGDRARRAAQSPRGAEIAAAFSLFSEAAEVGAILVAAVLTLAVRLGATGGSPPDGSLVLGSAAAQLGVDAFVEIVPRALLVYVLPTQLELPERSLVAVVSQAIHRRAVACRAATHKLDWRLALLMMLTGQLFVVAWVLQPGEGSASVFCGWSVREGWWHVVPCSVVP